jgi:hypothetical protein
MRLAAGSWRDYYEKQLRFYGYKIIIWRGKGEGDTLTREHF